MNKKNLTLGLATLLLTAGLALPAQAQDTDDSVWGWLSFLWRGWSGILVPAAEETPFEREILPAGVAADPFGRVRLLSSTIAPDQSDAGVSADPFG